MELVLTRRYYQKGTNGVLQYNGTTICHTIELPWRENWVCLSCIPEGRYRLKKRYTERFREHLLVRRVPGRTRILIHPANNAANQLKGCIAPVTTITGNGQGRDSRAALNKLVKLVYEHMDQQETVWLRIVGEAAGVQPGIVRPLVRGGSLRLCA